MKTKCKLLCVVMALLVTVVSLPLTSSAASLPADIPLIRITGGQAPLSDAEKDGVIYNSAFDLTMDSLDTILNNIKEPLIESIKKLDWTEAGRVAGTFLWELFGELQMYPDGTSKNAVYRAGTTAVPGYDDKAYISPKRQTQAVATALSLPLSLDSLSEPELTEETKSFIEKLNDIFNGIGTSTFDYIKDYIDNGSYKPKQPEPDPSWANVDSVSPKIYTFAFDWRQSPLAAADQLYDYVQAVKQHAGVDKVYLQSLSASGSVALAYIDKYINRLGCDDVAGVFISISLAMGAGTIGSVYNKKITADARTLSYAVIVPFIGELDEKTSQIVDLLYASGLLDLLFSLLEFAPPAFIDSFYESSIIPIYGTFPGMWSLVPREMYDSAVKACFGNAEEIEAKGYTDLVAKTDAYQALRLNSNEILREAAAKEGFKIAVVAGYGLSGWPLSVDKGLQGDDGVEAVYASFGATVSKMGETLGRNYKQADTSCGHNHISADNEVDASTCALPENTWLVKGIRHGDQYNYNGLFAWWYSTDNPTVTSSERWPQFLCVHGNQGMSWQDAIYPLQKPVGGEIYTFVSDKWNSILGMLSEIFYSVTRLLSEIFYGLTGAFRNSISM